MRIVLIAIFLLGTIAQSKISACQCGEEAKLCQCTDPPELSIHSNTITVSGQTVHLSGKLPTVSDHWFYSVTCHTSSRLFDFSLWKISKFHDHDGFYSAKSWNLQVMDSKDDHEKEIVFDRENEFYFWGNVENTNRAARVNVDTIVGLPKELHGTISLREVRGEKKQTH
ncbi:MAG: hypothetical protein ABSF70_19890 [Terracidiphilus sp.]|jgi:hypothetical protein